MAIIGGNIMDYNANMYLFVDNNIISESKNIDLVVHKPQKTGELCISSKGTSQPLKYWGSITSFRYTKNVAQANAAAKKSKNKYLATCHDLFIVEN